MLFPVVKNKPEENLMGVKKEDLLFSDKLFPDPKEKPLFDIDLNIKNGNNNTKTD